MPAAAEQQQQHQHRLVGKSSTSGAAIASSASKTTTPGGGLAALRHHHHHHRHHSAAPSTSSGLRLYAAAAAAAPCSSSTPSPSKSSTSADGCEDAVRTMDAERFARQQMRLSSARLAANVGFDTISDASLGWLADSLQRFLTGICANAKLVAEHSSRTAVTLDDVQRAFERINFSTAELNDYANQVDTRTTLDVRQWPPQLPSTSTSTQPVPPKACRQLLEPAEFVDDYLPPVFGLKRLEIDEREEADDTLQDFKPETSGEESPPSTPVLQLAEDVQVRERSPEFPAKTFDFLPSFIGTSASTLQLQAKAKKKPEVNGVSLEDKKERHKKKKRERDILKDVKDSPGSPSKTSAQSAPQIHENGKLLESKQTTATTTTTTTAVAAAATVTASETPKKKTKKRQNAVNGEASRSPRPGSAASQVPVKNTTPISGITATTTAATAATSASPSMPMLVREDGVAVAEQNSIPAAPTPILNVEKPSLPIKAKITAKDLEKKQRKEKKRADKEKERLKAEEEKKARKQQRREERRLWKLAEAERIAEDKHRKQQEQQQQQKPAIVLRLSDVQDGKKARASFSPNSQERTVLPPPPPSVVPDESGPPPPDPTSMPPELVAVVRAAAEAHKQSQGNHAKAEEEDEAEEDAKSDDTAPFFTADASLAGMGAGEIVSRLQIATPAPPDNARTAPGLVPISPDLPAPAPPPPTLKTAAAPVSSSDAHTHKHHHKKHKKKEKKHSSRSPVRTTQNVVENPSKDGVKKKHKRDKERDETKKREEKKPERKSKITVVEPKASSASSHPPAPKPPKIAAAPLPPPPEASPVAQPKLMMTIRKSVAAPPPPPVTTPSVAAPPVTAPPVAAPPPVTAPPIAAPKSSTAGTQAQKVQPLKIKRKLQPERPPNAVGSVPTTKTSFTPPEPHSRPSSRLMEMMVRTPSLSRPASSASVRDSPAESKTSDPPRPTSRVESPLSFTSLLESSAKKKKERRKKDEAAAAASRPSSSATNAEEDEIWICPVCSVAWSDSANMVGCDSCDNWYHWACVGLTEEPPADEKWYCSTCRSNRDGKARKRPSSSGPPKKSVAAGEGVPAKRGRPPKSAQNQSQQA